MLNTPASRLALAIAAVPVMIGMRSPLHAQNPQVAVTDSIGGVPRFDLHRSLRTAPRPDTSAALGLLP